MVETLAIAKPQDRVADVEVEAQRVIGVGRDIVDELGREVRVGGRRDDLELDLHGAGASRSDTRGSPRKTRTSRRNVSPLGEGKAIAGRVSVVAGPLIVAASRDQALVRGDVTASGGHRVKRVERISRPADRLLRPWRGECAVAVKVIGRRPGAGEGPLALRPPESTRRCHDRPGDHRPAHARFLR